MPKKCVYCGESINDNRSMEICDKCGVGTWGPKMWPAIKKTTDEAESKGDLCITNTCPFEERNF